MFWFLVLDRYALTVLPRIPAGPVSHTVCSCASTARASTAHWECISASSGPVSPHNHTYHSQYGANPLSALLSCGRIGEEVLLPLCLLLNLIKGTTSEF